MKTILKLNNLKNTLLAIFISVGLVATSNAATFDSEQMAQIESIIDEYVSNHPEVILRAMKKLEMDEKKLSGKYVRIPERSELNQEVNEQLIVEFYNR